MTKLNVGDRVEIAPHYDLWMQGARYGTIRHIYDKDGKTMVAVRMDHSQIRNLARMPISDVTKR